MGAKVKPPWPHVYLVMDGRVRTDPDMLAHGHVYVVCESLHEAEDLADDYDDMAIVQAEHVAGEYRNRRIVE